MILFNLKIFQIKYKLKITFKLCEFQINEIPINLSNPFICEVCKKETNNI